MSAPVIEVQLDTATFPAHTIIDITSIVLSGDAVFNIDADCGTATVNCSEKPSQANNNIRLYIYVDSVLLFNGFIVGERYNPDGTYTILCEDALGKLRNKWGGADRTYGVSQTPDSTDTSTVQNLVEASGIDSSLTSIQGAGFGIGLTGDVILHGGNIDISDPTKLVQGDVVLDLVRLLDKSVVPNYATFSRSDGVVARRAREIGTSSATFSDSSNAWGFTIGDRHTSSIVNKVNVIGKPLAGLPIQATSSAANSYLVTPFEYITEDLNTYIIENATDAQTLANWIVGNKNGRLNRVGFTTTITTSALLCASITMNSNLHGKTGMIGLVTTMNHHWDANTATTQITAEYRD